MSDRTTRVRVVEVTATEVVTVWVGAVTQERTRWTRTDWEASVVSVD